MKEFEPIRVHNCKNCSFPMRQFNPNTLMMVCESCGTRIGDSEPPIHKPDVPLNPLFKLHEQFEKNGVTWQVIGCQSYMGSIEEWDDEDNTWERTPWSYHTWWVLNEAREIAWVSQDKTGYSWSHKKTVNSGIPKGDMSYEIGNYTMVSAVGEFSYNPMEGEQVKSYEKDGRSLEILLDSNGQNKEIEAFHDVKLDLMNLLNCFKKQAVVDALKRFKNTSYAAFASVAVLFIGFFVMQAFEKTLMMTQSVSVNTQSLKKVIPLGQFKMESKGLIELSFTARSTTRNGSFDAEVVVTDSDKIPVVQLPLSFWRESGRDSDGPWTESKLRDAPRVSLPASDYYQLSLVPDSFKSWSAISLTGKVTSNVVTLFPIIVGGLIAVLLGLLLSILRRKRIRHETGISL